MYVSDEFVVSVLLPPSLPLSLSVLSVNFKLHLCLFIVLQVLHVLLIFVFTFSPLMLVVFFVFLREF